MDKKGQIAIFVIIAIVLVVSIGLFFAINRGVPILERSEEFNPETFIDKCIKDEVRDIVDVMLPQGGIVNPTDYKLYNYIKVPYLCKNENYYNIVIWNEQYDEGFEITPYSCVTQYPAYLKRLEREIEENVYDKIESCYVSLETTLIERGYEVSRGDITIDATLKPGIIETVVEGKMAYSKVEVSKSFEAFNVLTRSPLYEVGSVANEIASQEANYCHFSEDGFMFLYRDYGIQKYMFSDSTKIYTIEHKPTGATMNIATRGCVISPGF